MANTPVIPGFILVTPADEEFKPYLMNVASIQTVNPLHPINKKGVGCTINHDADNFEAVKESFEEVLLLMAAALN